jgi:hypothetical protein
MGYANIQADSNFYRQSLNADGIKDVTGPYTSLYEDVFRAITVTTDSVVSVTSYVGDSLSSQFLFAGTEIYGLFSSVTIHSGNAILHLAGASYISEIVNQYSASGIPLGFYEEGTQCLSQKISALLTQGVFDDASWVMVPSQYEEDWVRAFKPTSELGNLAFTRSSDATFTDSTGVVRRSPWNLVTFSEQFNNAAWTKDRVTVTDNVTTAPNGTLSADKIVDTLQGNNAYRVYNAVTLSAISYSASFYVKAAEYSWVYIRIGNSLRVWFNVTTGVVGGADSGIAGRIENAGNGWYRCTAIITTATAGGGFALLGLTNANNVESYTPTTGGQGVFVWGAQLVEGTEALPYFATTDRLNVPRLDYSNADGTLSTCPRLLLEPQRTNSIRNSSMVGAVAGSPGTLPTNYTSTSGTLGLTRTVVGTGTENGLPYLEMRFNGTASSTGSIRIAFDATTGIAATNGQTWSLSTYVKIVSSPNAPNSYALIILERNSFGSGLAEGSATIVPTTSQQRFTYTRTNAAGACAFVETLIGFALTSGATYDFTIRIAAPQMELGAYATTWVPTTTAAVTRIADAASKTGVSSLIGQTEGTLFAEFAVPLNESITRSLVLSSSTVANRAAISTFAGSVFARVDVGGVNQVNSNATMTVTNMNKVAFRYKENDFAVYVNGVKVITDTSGITFPAGTLDRFAFIQPDSTSAFNGTVSKIAFYKTGLIDSQLQALTTL